MADELPPAILASDAEREHACSLLRDASVEGRLTLDEFGQRVEQVLAARTRDDLARVTGDLPAVPRLSATARPPVRWLVAVLGSIERKGFWRIGEECSAVAVMGGCAIDLRGAVVSAPVTTIRCVAVMSGIEVIVPDGVEVELDGFSLMGGRDLRLDGPPPPPGAPVIRIVAVSLMGGVSVRDRPGVGGRVFDAVDDHLRGR